MPVQAEKQPLQALPSLSMGELYLADEDARVRQLLSQRLFSPEDKKAVQERARRLVEAVRRRGAEAGGIEAFMREYNLASEEGVVLMCLAEALLRIPDDRTLDLLIRDKLTGANWDRHLGRSHSLFVNASTWGLMLTGRLVQQPQSLEQAEGLLRKLVRQSGEPMVRNAIRQGMRIIAHQFVLGRSVDEAVARGKSLYGSDYRYSFDMLGESAMTREDADGYFTAYLDAIRRLRQLKGDEVRSVLAADSISVKLSALHPRYEYRQHKRLRKELLPRLEQLAGEARQAGLGLTFDAEESERLNISLGLFAALYGSRVCEGWEGLGLAVQAYQKRAPAVIEGLMALARAHRRRIPLRLVKGAYWDAEIKRAQELGLRDYPLFTRKAATDLSYLVCAKRILQAEDCFYPQFATHNAHTIASLLQLAQDGEGFELQRLHGMGGNLYACLQADGRLHPPRRIYAPVGSHTDLLPYLVRRLLENGANSSIVNRIEDDATPIESIIRDPADRLRAYPTFRHPGIAPPGDLYGPGRRNSRGLNLDDPRELEQLRQEIDKVFNQTPLACPLVRGEALEGEFLPVTNPADRDAPAGSVAAADRDAVQQALKAGEAGAEVWGNTSPKERAAILQTSAELIERQRGELVGLCVREGGRNLPDALAEVREAVDFCRYYAQQLESEFAAGKRFQGPTGEENSLTLHGRGLFVCISPWNFPIAIFTGQIAAALAAGNGVIAKPASQTPLVGMRIVQLMHEAGVPLEALHYVPGPGAKLGAQLLADPRIDGVAFTGSTETARAINQTLANRPGPIIPLIAETGGQNAMVVDSSALPEQAVADIIQSAFNSAGQPCSALRVLYLQEDIAPRVLRMLSGTMQELQIGDPRDLATDMGPVIDEASCETLRSHVQRMRQAGRFLCSRALDSSCENGCFFSPHLFEIDDPALLKGEVFGPILHVIRWPAHRLDRVIRQIRQTGYGLTLGIHSRVESRIEAIRKQLPVGNVYVNRNMIGAVVGVQPFGGEGLSGTGPKAGGPYTLLRYATERSLAVNTAAIGGNAHLLALDDE